MCSELIMRFFSWLLTVAAVVSLCCRRCSSDWVFNSGQSQFDAVVSLRVNTTHLGVVFNRHVQFTQRIVALGVYRSPPVVVHQARLLETWSNETSETPWLALMERAVEHDFLQRLHDALTRQCAGVVFYDTRNQRRYTDIHLPSSLGATATAVQVSEETGQRLTALLAMGAILVATVESKPSSEYNDINRYSSVPPVLTYFSLAILCVISVVWMVIYCVLRARLIRMSSSNKSVMSHTTSKILSQLVTRSLTMSEVGGDLTACCVVCLESFRCNDHVTVLPCRHYFHRLCIQPWLIRQMECPICKLNLLNFFGLASTSEESVVEFEEQPANFSGDQTTELQTSSQNTQSTQSGVRARRCSFIPSNRCPSTRRTSTRRTSDTVCCRPSMATSVNVDADDDGAPIRRQSAPARPSLQDQIASDKLERL